MDKDAKIVGRRITYESRDTKESSSGCHGAIFGTHRSSIATGQCPDDVSRIHLFAYHES